MLIIGDNRHATGHYALSMQLVCLHTAPPRYLHTKTTCQVPQRSERLENALLHEPEHLKLKELLDIWGIGGVTGLYATAKAFVSAMNSGPALVVLRHDLPNLFNCGPQRSCH
jgi:hypothetical protein